ncbi:MAG: SMC-Scp complex subunit ScpB [bacterium]|nr:SMC-Scp complex subunit ScpB [bacterium]
MTERDSQQDKDSVLDLSAPDFQPSDNGKESADFGDDSPFLKGATEALIFASTEPLTESQYAAALGKRHASRLGEIVRELNMDYEREGRAFEILHVAGGYQFFTRRDYSGVLRKLFVERARTRLSRAALETLAVVAFRGPVTRGEIDEIRGVDSGGVLRTLLDRRLIAIRGRAQVIGRPLLYETTPDFLKHFGLADLSELPQDSELLREWGQHRDQGESGVTPESALPDETPAPDVSTKAIENGRPAPNPAKETDSEEVPTHDA